MSDSSDRRGTSGAVFIVVTYPLLLAVGQSLRATRGEGFVGLRNYA